MKHMALNIRIFALGVLLTTNVQNLAAEEARDVELNSEKALLSYSLGNKMGFTVKKQTLDVDVELFLRGMRDVLTDQEPLLGREEMSKLIAAYFKKRQENARQDRKELAQKNLNAGKEFLAENAKKEGVTVLPSGLQYEVITSGDGKTPGDKDRVSIHYRGTLIDGTEFGSSYEREIPFSFRVDSAVPGQVEALKLMREGDKWRLFIPTELAYGPQGRRGLVGPNETLIFEVELLSINPEPPKPVIEQPNPKQAADDKTG